MTGIVALLLDVEKENNKASLIPKKKFSLENNFLPKLISKKLLIGKVYKDFEFIGPSPIDYDSQLAYGECVWEELCNFNLEKLIKKGILKIGVIFNLDPHYKGGSHWVSLFVDVKRKMIYYFDSVGEKIPRRIKKFANKVKKQSQVMDIDFEIDEIHPHEHQKSDTECGIYSLYFITTMIKSPSSWEKVFKNGKVPDEKMEKYRKIYFNTVF